MHLKEISKHVNKFTGKNVKIKRVPLGPKEREISKINDKNKSSMHKPSLSDLKQVYKQTTIMGYMNKVIDRMKPKRNIVNTRGITYYNSHVSDASSQAHGEANKQINIVTWNVSGLLGRLLDGEVVAFLKKYDIICIQETFLLYDFNTSFKFPNYKAIQSPASKLSKAGRPSGGILILYKKELDKYLKVVNTEVKNMLCLRINQNMLNTDNDILLITLYVHPIHSTYYKVTGNEDTLDQLNDFIGELVEHNEWEDILISGDVNSRISDWRPCIKLTDDT